MIITGTEKYTYEIYPQSGMSINFATNAMDDFSFRALTNSGGYYYQDIVFESGKVFAGYRSSNSYNFVGSYTKGDPFEFEFRYNTGKFALYLNEKIKMDGYPILSNGVQSIYDKPAITGFVFSGLNSGFNLDAELSVYGQLPIISFSDLYLKDFGVYSGSIVISGFPSKLNYINSPGISSITIPTSKFTSGDYQIISNDFQYESFASIDFQFDFANVNVNLPIPRRPQPIRNSELSFESSEVVSGLIPYSQYLDYKIYNNIHKNEIFESYLTFLYRSGDIDIFGSGEMTGILSGNMFNGFGTFFGSGTGIVSSGHYFKTGIRYPIYGSDKVYKDEMFQNAYATGKIVYEYDIPATGVENNIHGNTFQSTGNLTGYLTGYVNDGSGHYHFYQQITGRPRFWRGNWQTGNQTIGGYYSDGSSPDAISQYLNTYESINYTGFIDQKAYFEGSSFREVKKPFEINYTSGFYSDHSGHISGFDLKTGQAWVFDQAPNHVDSNYYSYSGNANISGRYLRKTPEYRYSTRGSGNYEYGMRVSHDGNMPEGLIDYYVLTITDGNNTGYISGSF